MYEEGVNFEKKCFRRFRMNLQQNWRAENRGGSPLSCSNYPIELFDMIQTKVESIFPEPGYYDHV